jgi:hypothetical protein
MSKRPKSEEVKGQEENEEILEQEGDLRISSSIPFFPDGSPTTPSELRDRFENFVSTLIKGKDAGKTRIVLE